MGTTCLSNATACLQGNPTLAVMLLENGIDIHATIESSASSQQVSCIIGDTHVVHGEVPMQ